jgi:hypothetical protein
MKIFVHINKIIIKLKTKICDNHPPPPLQRRHQSIQSGGEPCSSKNAHSPFYYSFVGDKIKNHFLCHFHVLKQLWNYKGFFYLFMALWGVFIMIWTNPQRGITGSDLTANTAMALRLLLSLPYTVESVKGLESSSHWPNWIVSCGKPQNTSG